MTDRQALYGAFVIAVLVAWALVTRGREDDGDTCRRCPGRFDCGGECE